MPRFTYIGKVADTEKWEPGYIGWYEFRMEPGFVGEYNDRRETILTARHWCDDHKVVFTAFGNYILIRWEKDAMMFRMFHA